MALIHKRRWNHTIGTKLTVWNVDVGQLIHYTLAFCSKLPALEHLLMQSNTVNGTLEPLAKNSKLKALHLVSLNGLKNTFDHLLGLSELKRFVVDDKDMPGMKRFQERHPECMVECHDD